MLTHRIGITWQLTDVHGWGVFGTNVAVNLIQNGPVPPLILSPPYFVAPDARQQQLLEPFLQEGQNIMAQIEAAGRQATLNEVLMLHSLGNAFMHQPITDQVRGHTNIGFIFFESPQMDDQALARARQFDKIIAGSSWNRDLIRDHGIENAAFVAQGVDLFRFRPRRKTGKYGGRFVVFSGGKLELRKGQDIVLAAFKRFHERHPDALLVTNWHNAWAETAKNMALSPHFSHEPQIDGNGLIGFPRWAADAGIPEDAYLDVGVVPNDRVPSIIAEADIALFPNRCEGGTNLVAMETMASGIPCILSANTGHLDIIGTGNCYPLRNQKPSPPEIDTSGVWGESDIDEIVACLENAYENRDEAVQIGRAGAAFMKSLSWKNQTAALVDAVSEFMA
ncbi:MAG: glycosyltransferase family 4 protein [Rhodospirillales bacterium]